MFEDYVIPTRRRTAEDVLAVFVAYHRVSHRERPLGVGRSEPTMHTRLIDWHFSAPIGFPPLFRACYNRLFRTNLSLEQWRTATAPTDHKTLGDLCRAIADAGSNMDLIEPMLVFGESCQTAGAFAFLIARLRDDGFVSHHIAPSTPLVPIVNAARRTFENLALEQPQLLPRMHESGDKTFLFLAATAAMLGLAWLGIVSINKWLDWGLPNCAVGGGMIGMFLVLSLPAMRIGETFHQLRFDGLETVGDFCRLIAADASRDMHPFGLQTTCDESHPKARPSL